jgi:hypothetical protein
MKNFISLRSLKNESGNYEITMLSVCLSVCKSNSINFLTNWYSPLNLSRRLCHSKLEDVQTSEMEAKLAPVYLGLSRVKFGNRGNEAIFW